MSVNRLKRVSLASGIVANRAVANTVIAIAAAAVVLSLSACTDEQPSTEDKV
ncbi:cytochrome c, partial [Vibrio breoganii]